MIEKTQKSLNVMRVYDDRSVRISKRKSGYQYYLIDANDNMEYVKLKDIDKVKRIAQRDYYQAVLDKMMTMRYRIDRFLKVYDMESIEMVYDKLCEARKALVVPVISSDEEYIMTWRNENVGGQNPFPEEGKFLTIRGEKVRSKSEKILADMFEKEGIPYSYEPQIKLNDGRCLYPDFALLNIRTRKTVYWEHMGLISDGDYAKSALNKLNLFEQSGVRLGEDLIISMESPKMPLKLKQVEEQMQRYLM